MRKVAAALLCMMLGGGLVYVAFQYHLVRTSDELVFVPKTSAGLSETYVDVRAWSALEWQRHPRLIRALWKHGRSDLIVAPGTNGLLRDLFRSFRSAEHEPPDRETQ
jgi:hypothetical protein